MITFLIHHFVYFSYGTGQSMMPTLVSDSLTLDINSRLVTIARGDIVSASKKNCDYLLNKRVIGVPGDVVVIAKNGEVFINGVQLEEPYINDSSNQNRSVYPRCYILKDNEYILLGDNRNHSSDSRWYGIFTQSDIVGKNILAIDLTKK